MELPNVADMTLKEALAVFEAEPEENKHAKQMVRWLRALAAHRRAFDAAEIAYGEVRRL